MSQYAAGQVLLPLFSVSRSAQIIDTSYEHEHEHEHKNMGNTVHQWYHLLVLAHENEECSFDAMMQMSLRYVSH